MIIEPEDNRTVGDIEAVVPDGKDYWIPCKIDGKPQKILISEENKDKFEALTLAEQKAMIKRLVPIMEDDEIWQ